MKTILAAYSGVLKGTGTSFLSALQDLPSPFWPCKSKMKKHLQCISVLQWVLSFLALGAVATVLLVYMFCTDCWLIAAMYTAWLIFDWNTPKQGGRRSSWVRSWTVWTYFRDYFPVRATSFSKKFPGIKPSLATLAGNFRFPLLRDYLMSGGICPVNRNSMDYLLTCSGTGNAVVIVVGGARRVPGLRSGGELRHPEEPQGVRRTWCQSTLFGENDAYQQVIFGEGSWWRLVQRRLQKSIGFAPCLFHGCSLFSAERMGHLGEPITVPKVEEPSAEVVDQYHAMYVRSLQGLFDKYKTRFGLKESDVLQIQ
ncbi:hypothetical protein CRUP_017566 [Coryphaenoides rupestris]|nr:hypothetical protein CRUP_017566 [Coryphaenoides rupestris]